MSSDDQFPRPPVELLPRFQEWKVTDTRSFTLEDFMKFEGNLDLAAAHAQFFYPEFIEIRGCIIFKDRHDAESLDAWIRKCDGDLSSVESIINHMHFYDFPTNDTRKSEHRLETYEYLAKIAKRTWKAALAEQFPGRQFEFQYVTELDEYGPTLYFWQVRPPANGDSV